MLEFNVKNQIIERTDSFKAVADSRNYLCAKFNFSEEWESPVTAIFGYGNEYYSVIFTDNTCTVPWEVIKAPFFTVSLVCGDRITANRIKVDVEKSGFLEGESPKEPTPDVYNQIIESVKAPYIGVDGNWHQWSKDEKAFINTNIKAEGQAGVTPVLGTDYWTEEDKAQIKGYVDEKILGGAW